MHAVNHNNACRSRRHLGAGVSGSLHHRCILTGGRLAAAFGGSGRRAVPLDTHAELAPGGARQGALPKKRGDLWLAQRPQRRHFVGLPVKPAGGSPQAGRRARVDN